MTVKNSKRQDYLAVGNYAAKIRQDSTLQYDFLSTTDATIYRHLTTPATRLAGVRLVTDTVIASGSVAVTISRVRAGSLTTLATFTLDGSIVTAVDTPTELPEASIAQGVSVQAGDSILFATVGAGPPTAANFGVAIQFAQNGPR